MSATTTNSPTAVAVLEAIGTSHEPLSQAELALKTGKARPTVSAAVKALVDQGAIVIVRDSKPNKYTLAGLGDGVDEVPAAVETAPDLLGALEASLAEVHLMKTADPQRFTAEEVDTALNTLAEEITATQVPGLHDGAHKVPGAAPACHCGDDQVGHVAHPAAAPAAKDARGSVEKARTAALAALGRAGAEGMKVSAVWAVMQTEGGIVWVGAYRLLNRMRRENGVIVTGEHKAENRTARLAPR